MCEIRFNVSNKDGKLEGMLNAIPAGIRTEVVKEALRYFLNDVRDSKVESNYIDSSLLSNFKTDVKQSLFSIEDVFKILDSRQATVQSVAPSPIIVTQQIETKNEDTIEVEEKPSNEDEFDLDLSNNEFDSNNIDVVDMNDVDFENMDF